MKHASSPREAVFLSSRIWKIRIVFLFSLALVLCACGGGTSSSQSAPGGGSGSGNPPFQARPFPGDYFMRMPNWDSGGIVSDAAYDPTLKEVFVSNPDVNEIEVYSTTNGQYIGGISVPGPAGLSFSPDFSQLVVGTITPYIYLVDPAALHVTTQIAVPAAQLMNDPAGDTTMPVMPYAMSDGSIFLGMGVTTESSSSAYVFVSHLVKYVPSSQTYTLEDPNASGITANPARSGDGNYLIIAGVNNSSAALMLYSISAEAYVATSSPIQNAVAYLAANADGSQFASTQEIPGAGYFSSQIVFWSSSLNSENTYTTSASLLSGPIYSRDGKYLYFMPSDILCALNAQTGSVSGYLGVEGVGTQFFDADETYNLFAGTVQSGIAIVNASQLQTTLPVSPPGLSVPGANPDVGPVAGGTQVQFISASPGPGSADGIANSMEAYFGGTPATQNVVAPYPASSDGGNFLTATAPPTATPGPVSVVLTDASNNATFLPDGYTYGPRILRVAPSLVSAAGGDQITITAYGLGLFDMNQVQVTIGGASGRVAGLNTDSSEYPEETVTVVVPPGTPGWANIVLTTPNGTDSLENGLEYLQNEANLGGGPFAFAVYDSVRNLFYLTGDGNSVAVFDPQTQTMQQPLQSPSISSSAVLQSEALTPDSNALLVADPADATVVIFDLQAGTSNAVKVLLPSDPSVTLSAPMSVVAAADNRAFVSLSPCITDPVREINLTNLAVQTRPDAASTCAPYVPYPQLGGSSGDGNTIIFAGNSEEEPPGPEYVWSYKAASDVFQGPVMTADKPWVAGDGAANSDGTVIAVSQGTLDQRLLPLVPIGPGSLDGRLNETGSLLYGISINGSVAVSDTHHGRRLFVTADVPEGQFGLTVGPYRTLAIDPTGQQILVATQAGLAYFQLSVVPLAIGTVTPSEGPAGTTIQLKGSGFVAGTAVKIGGQNAACSDVDTETISCTVPNLSSGQTYIVLTNPDGQSYSFENAFLVQ